MKRITIADISLYAIDDKTGIGKYVQWNVISTNTIYVTVSYIGSDGKSKEREIKVNIQDE